MSLKYVATRFARNVLLLFRSPKFDFAKRRHHQIEGLTKDVQGYTPSRYTLRLGGSSGGARARFFYNPFANYVPSELRRRLTDRLFHGNSTRLFSLIGLSFAGGLMTKDDEQDVECWNIREAVAKFPYDFYYYGNDIIQSIKLDDLLIGESIAKGSCAVVYSAKLKNVNRPVETSNLELTPSPDATFDERIHIEHPLALKIMFNYDIQSNSPAIFSAMCHEIVPARSHRIDDDISFWENTFVKQIKKLPPHPNIVAIYSAFTDYMPNLVDSMEIYPDALPSAYNPNGLGRNMTLFLLMKRYKSSLCDFFKNHDIRQNDSVFLFAQLLEAVAHLNRHGIAHRDLKSDNILIEEVQTDKGNLVPLLVISDFGCCLADKRYGLKLPYTSDYISKGGNMNLMAPEIINQQPGVFSYLDYRKSDLWAAGTVAYELFGFENPFSSSDRAEVIFSHNYTDDQLPEIESAPMIIQKLVKNILSKNPDQRLSAEVAANVCQLYLWAPSSWFTAEDLPTNEDILKWLTHLAIKLICEGKLLHHGSDIASKNPEYYLITSFLLRIRFTYIKKALQWIRSNY